MPSIAVGTLENIQQLIFFTFYLFAVMFFAFQLPNAFVIFGHDHRTGYSIVLVAFSYAADVMIVLLFLHSLQWLLSARLARLTRTIRDVPK